MITVDWSNYDKMLEDTLRTLDEVKDDINKGCETIKVSHGYYNPTSSSLREQILRFGRTPKELGLSYEDTMACFDGDMPPSFCNESLYMGSRWAVMNSVYADGRRPSNSYCISSFSGGCGV